MGRSSSRGSRTKSSSNKDAGGNDHHNASMESATLDDSTTRIGDEYTVDSGNMVQFTDRANGLLGRMFHSCQDDPRGSVHRAWGVCLFFVAFYFAIAVTEMIQLQSHGGSIALVIASVWTGLVHFVLIILGTFVLRRFPTSFSIGFLLGFLAILANQNLILFVTFYRYGHGSTRVNHAFAGLGFALCVVLTFMALLLTHFKQDIVMAPMSSTATKDGDSATMDGSNGLNMA